MTDFIVLAVLAVVLGAAIRYIVKSKKAGVKCIGCPSGCSCGGSCSGHDENGGCGC